MKKKSNGKKHITLIKGNEVARIFEKGYVEYQSKSGAIGAEWIGKTPEEAKKALVAKGWKVTAENKVPKMEIKREVPSHKCNMKYVKNLDIGGNRTLRMEVIGGEVADDEAAFLTATLHFIGGTLGRNSSEHTGYVAYMMTKLTKHLVRRIRGQEEGEDIFNSEDTSNE